MASPSQRDFDDKGSVGTLDITEIRIKLMEESEDRLRAFCSITIDDCFVVRDLKIIDGSNGPFVAMPSRKLTGHCPRCRHKNHLRAVYCNHCGSKLGADSGGGLDSPQKLYADVAHPINSACRELIQSAVVQEFQAELARSQQPGYRSRYDDDFVDAGPEEGIESEPLESLESKGDSLPKRPHFLDRDKQQRTNPSDEGESFGAGIF